MAAEAPHVVQRAILEAMDRVCRQAEPHASLADSIVAHVMNTHEPGNDEAIVVTNKVYQKSCKLMMDVIQGKQNAKLCKKKH